MANYAEFKQYTHIAIYDSHAGNGWGYFLGQNQGGTHFNSGGAFFNVVKLPYSSTNEYAFQPYVLTVSNSTNKNQKD